MHVVTHTRWLRHAATLPDVAVGAWYGVENGSSGAFLVAGAGALAWFLWTEASWSVTWRRRRRTEDAGARIPRAVSRALRGGAKAEKGLASPCGASECSEGRIRPLAQSAWQDADKRNGVRNGC